MRRFLCVCALARTPPSTSLSVPDVSPSPLGTFRDVKHSGFTVLISFIPLSLFGCDKPSIFNDVETVSEVALHLALGSNPAFYGSIILILSKSIEAGLHLAGRPSYFSTAFSWLYQRPVVQRSLARPRRFCLRRVRPSEVIGATSEAQPLLDKAGVVADKGVVTSKNGAPPDPFLGRAAMGRIWEREPSVRTVF